MKKLLYIGNKLSRHGNTPTGIEILGPLLEQEGMEVVYASSQKSKVLRMLEMVWKTLIHWRTHYVLIDTYSTSNFWYAFVVSQLCRLLGLKYIAILHGGGLPRRLRKDPKLCLRIFGNAYANVAPSEYLVEKFHAEGYKNVVYIPNPVELKYFTFKARPSIGPNLLWVRSLSPIYNPEMALRVTQLLKEDYPDAKLCFVGPDKRGMRPGLFQIAERLKIEVVYSGRKSKAEWAEIATDYDVFINTSRIDNAPYSLIEAASLGLPIVTTNVGGIPFLFDDRKTAMLVNSKDAIAMADAIRELIADKMLRDKIIAGAFELSREFEWQKIRRKWLQILE